MIKQFGAALTALVLAGHWPAAIAVSRIEVQALMKDAAILRIDGRQLMLRSGERSTEGVLLVNADPRRALIEVEGQRRELNLSQRIAATFEQNNQTEVQIPRNHQQQYLTTAEINGRRTMAMVDTGAYSVALSSAQAERLGIDYRKGQPTRVGTAGGMKNAYTVTLDKVNVGDIAVHFVTAAVIEGDYPSHVLLGITYLQHVGMREENGIMYLRKKH